MVTMPIAAPRSTSSSAIIWCAMSGVPFTGKVAAPLPRNSFEGKLRHLVANLRVSPGLARTPPH
eukprot:12933903-Prorocentrum_lima.AAC.1